MATCRCAISWPESFGAELCRDADGLHPISTQHPTNYITPGKLTVKQLPSVSAFSGDIHSNIVEKCM